MPLPTLKHMLNFKHPHSASDFTGTTQVLKVKVKQVFTGSGTTPKFPHLKFPRKGIFQCARKVKQSGLFWTR